MSTPLLSLLGPPTCTLNLACHRPPQGPDGGPPPPPLSSNEDRPKKTAIHMRAARNILDLVLMSRNALPREAGRNGREKDPVRLTSACDISEGKQYQTAQSISIRCWLNQISTRHRRVPDLRKQETSEEALESLDIQCKTGLKYFVTAHACCSRARSQRY